MRFAHPEYFLLLGLIPFAVAYLLLFRSKDIPALRFPSMKDIDSLSGVARYSVGEYVVGFLRIAALILIVLALARPQEGLRSEEVTHQATDIMICLDVSRSMLAIDFKPKDRFQVSRDIVRDFIGGRVHDRVGMVLFSETAVTLSPLTHDKQALLDILDTIEIGVIPADRTAIGMGIANSVNRLKDSQARSKVIVLLTDGANNTGLIDPLTAAKTASALGIKLYTIGAASPDGGMVPIQDPVRGRVLVKIEDDIDEDVLLRVAEETGGRYFRAKTADALKTIFKEIDAMEKTDIKVTEFMDYEDHFHRFLIIALMLLLVELILKKTMFRTIP